MSNFASTSYTCQHTCNCRPVLGVQVRVDLVEQVERRRITLLDGEYCRQSHERFLPTRELLYAKALVHFRVEGYLKQDDICQSPLGDIVYPTYLDRHARVVVDPTLTFTILVLIAFCLIAVDLPLDD